MSDLNKLNIGKANDGLRKKKFSSVELVKDCLKRIEEVEKNLNAFVTVSKKEALEKAKQADKLLAKKNTRKLLGIPISIKDNYCTRGIRTTASSKVLDNYIPPYNATVWQKLEDEGAILIGKTNMDAWAHGSSTETSDYGVTKNPWDTSRIPGGSSGGSAASAAADEVVASIGSETAGSVRGPASWCGVVGFKPTYGRVSRFGVIAMGSSFDCPGPLTKNVEDSALIMSIIAGKDEHDGTTLSLPKEDYVKNLSEKLPKMTIGYSEDYLKGVDKKVSENIFSVISKLEKKGFKTKKIKLFDPKYAIAVYTILQRSEVSSNLARYDGIRYGFGRDKFGDEARRRIMLGTYTLSAGYYDAYYLKAQKVRTEIIQDFEKAFSIVDLIVGPTLPDVAPKIGVTEGQAMFGELCDALLEPSSIAGLPGISIPSGIKDGLPIGFQIFGPQKSEALILKFASQLEKEIGFERKVSI